MIKMKRKLSYLMGYISDQEIRQDFYSVIDAGIESVDINGDVETYIRDWVHNFLGGQDDWKSAHKDLLIYISETVKMEEESRLLWIDIISEY